MVITIFVVSSPKFWNF